MTAFLHISFSDFHSFSKNRCVIQTKVVTIASPYFLKFLCITLLKEVFMLKRTRKKISLIRGKHVSEVLTLQLTPAVLPVK